MWCAHCEPANQWWTSQFSPVQLHGAESSVHLKQAHHQPTGGLYGSGSGPAGPPSTRSRFQSCCWADAPLCPALVLYCYDLWPGFSSVLLRLFWESQRVWMYHPGGAGLPVQPGTTSSDQYWQGHYQNAELEKNQWRRIRRELLSMVIPFEGVHLPVQLLSGVNCCCVSVIL